MPIDIQPSTTPVPSTTVITPSSDPVKAAEGVAASPDAPKAPEPNANRFAALSRKEKAIRQEREAVKAEKAQAEATLKAEREAFAAEKAEADGFKTLKSKAKQSPLEVLKAFGLTYDDVANHLINGQVPKEVLAVQEQVEALKAERVAEKRAALEAEAARLESARTEAVQTYHAQVIDFVKAAPDTYELIHARNEFDQVPLIIEENFRVHGTILQPKEAADLLESHLEEELTKQTATKKFLSKQQPKADPQAKADPQQSPVAQPRTLTNSMSASSSSYQSQMKDREKRALEALDRHLSKQ